MTIISWHRSRGIHLAASRLQIKFYGEGPTRSGLVLRTLPAVVRRHKMWSITGGADAEQGSAESICGEALQGLEGLLLKQLACTRAACIELV